LANTPSAESSRMTRKSKPTQPTPSILMPDPERDLDIAW
jgi:hypothetical protein